MKSSPSVVVLPFVVLVLLDSAAQARVVQLQVERRETLLAGRTFGLAGPYEKLVGTIAFALDPDLPQNRSIVDLSLAPRNARGEVEFSADFFLLKPIDPKRGNGRLFYEAGNRGRKGILATFQRADPSEDPTTEAEIGDGSLMRQGFTLLWMGWQWDVPEGRMRMEMPVASEDQAPITGWVRGNFILGQDGPTASLADRGHRGYPVLDATSNDDFMTVRDLPLDKPRVVPREKWRFVDSQTVALDGGFVPGKIYDVVYRSVDPKVVGCGLAGTRDIVSFFKYEEGDENPAPGIRHALAWGVSQTGRFLRHFLYQGFNEDESGRRVFDGVLDQVGGAGRGSFNHRFGQASRDTLQHFNIFYPVDMFPFTDKPQTDPETGLTDSLLGRAVTSRTDPKIFHILTNSEYFHRGGSLIHTDVSGSTDVEPSENSRIYLIASAPHIVGQFPPAPYSNPEFSSQASMNPLVYTPVVRALFRALDQWVAEGVAPPPSLYPRIADGTLTAPASAGWPKISGFALPDSIQTPHRLDFGPDWERGIVTFEPPRVGKPFGVRVPAVDVDGNDRAGIRLPEIAVPLATHTGWNYRHPGIGAPDRLASEIGSYFPFPRRPAERQRAGDRRASIEERYHDQDHYLGKITRAALELVEKRYLLAQDLPEVIQRAAAHYEWATSARR